jgi:hypothetical protein
MLGRRRDEVERSRRKNIEVTDVDATRWNAPTQVFVYLLC